MDKLKKAKSKKPNFTGFIRRNKKNASNLGYEASDHIDRLFINRLQNLAHSWRFVLSWLLLVVLLVWVLAVQTRALKTYYTQVVPRDGGTYVEGVVGPLTNVNPIFASSAADQAVSRLLFAGLMRYDENNQLVTDLAESITSDEKASVFTVKLRDDILWHDGQKLTAQDVVYTVRTMQQPDARSPLQRSWQGVIVQAPDNQTVTFTLPGSFSPFPTLLTFGVLPKHLLDVYAPSQLRSAEFNSSAPIGSGPFKFQRIVNVARSADAKNEIKVQLVANEDYHHGVPKLKAFTFWVAPSRERLTEIFKEGQLSGASDINIQAINLAELGATQKTFSQTIGVYMFYKTSNGHLQDPEMRKALTQAISVSKASAVLDEPVRTIDSPLLKEQLGYDPAIVQIGTDVEQSKAKLEALGWVMQPDGIRAKDGIKLSFSIVTERDTDYQPIAEEIARQLIEVGVDAVVDLRDKNGFTENVLQNHVYSDMLIYGINVGVDPDVYSFWHSSQASENSTIRLNLSEYVSETADAALEGGRSRVDVATRIDKYRSFLGAWVADVPAVAIYRPTFKYYEVNNIRGPGGDVLLNQVDRYRDVHLWTVLTDRIKY